ncbi:Krueppel 1 [Nymphon striatum]|nr:Krueppel 1 [Nymphon striatum]
MSDKKNDFNSKEVNAVKTTRTIIQEENTTSCGKCGLQHEKFKCPAYNKKCFKCDKIRHFRIYCRTKIFIELNFQSYNVKDEINKTVQMPDEMNVINMFVGNIDTARNIQSDFNRNICKHIIDSAFSKQNAKHLHDLDVNSSETKQRIYLKKVKLNYQKECKRNVCHRNFGQGAYLTRHMHLHLQNNHFECEVCHKCFTEKSSLTKHVRIHTNEKPFKCEVCHRRFTQNVSLKNHMRVHTNEKPFKCYICHKVFSENGNLTKHMCVHTNSKPFE